LGRVVERMIGRVEGMVEPRRVGVRKVERWGGVGDWCSGGGGVRLGGCRPSQHPGRTALRSHSLRMHDGGRQVQTDLRIVVGCHFVKLWRTRLKKAPSMVDVAGAEAVSETGCGLQWFGES
jgi:hypothetical protein